MAKAPAQREAQSSEMRPGRTQAASKNADASSERPVPDHASAILQMQRIHGNRTVARSLTSERPTADSGSVYDAKTGCPTTASLTQLKGHGSLDKTAKHGPDANMMRPSSWTADTATANHTGLPDSLKAGLEQLSGFDLSGVRVNYNSAKPAQLNALAYARGQNIEVGPGQERHLPHEGWHVVQQIQGRVQPTFQTKGVPINDDGGLEREADKMGERALELPSSRQVQASSTSLQRRKGAAPSFSFSSASQSVVQRDIGFEYETGADTYEIPAGTPLPTPAQRGIHALPPGAIAFNPPVTLIQNMNGLHAKSDVGGAGIGSNLEFETDHFPETANGRKQLHKALKNLERFIAVINANQPATPHFRATQLAFSFGGTAPNSRRFIFANVPITGGNPQATVGVRANRIAELMEQQVGGPTGGPHVPAAAAPLARIELGYQIPNIADFQSIGDAPRQVRAAYPNYCAAAAPLIPPALSAELVGLCALILTYIEKGAGPQVDYAKGIAPVMARTDFGTIFNLELGAAETAFYSAGAGAEFCTLFTHILHQAGVVGGLGPQLFAANPANAAAISGHLTRQLWIQQISQGTDLLTRTTFPNVAAQPDMFGLGGLLATRDTVDPAGANVLAPIFEFRRMRKGMTPHQFVESAMGIFDYVASLNSGNPTAPYSPVGRAARTPKLSQIARYSFFPS